MNKTEANARIAAIPPKLDRLKEVLSYNPATGQFVWLKSTSNAAPVGVVAGRCKNSDGYIQISIDKHSYKAHRLAWLYVYGEWPEHIDHINGVRSDNRIANLRNVGRHANMQNQKRAHANSSTGLLGVVPRKNGRFQAQIRSRGVKSVLGTYGSALDAHAAYMQAKAALHEGFAEQVK